MVLTKYEDENKMNKKRNPDAAWDIMSPAPAFASKQDGFYLPGPKTAIYNLQNVMCIAIESYAEIIELNDCRHPRTTWGARPGWVDAFAILGGWTDGWVDLKQMDG